MQNEQAAQNVDADPKKDIPISMQFHLFSDFFVCGNVDFLQ
jgi:hypothetical protein